MATKRRPIQHLNFPQHVQGMLDQEERLLKQTLDSLTRETTNTIRIITREQQVIATKLKTLEQRLAASQMRSQQALEECKRKEEAARRLQSRSLTLTPIPVLHVLPQEERPTSRAMSAGTRRDTSAGRTRVSSAGRNRNNEPNARIKSAGKRPDQRFSSFFPKNTEYLKQ